MFASLTYKCRRVPRGFATVRSDVAALTTTQLLHTVAKCNRQRCFPLQVALRNRSIGSGFPKPDQLHSLSGEMDGVSEARSKHIFFAERSTACRNGQDFVGDADPHT